MDYISDEIFGRREDDTTDFKNEYKQEDVAIDICSFANGLKISHLYYGIECEDGTDTPIIPGIAKKTKKLSMDIERIEQSIQSTVYNTLSPPPIFEVHQDPIGFIKVTIEPTTDICEMVSENRKRTVYQSYFRIGHNNKPCNMKDRQRIMDQKVILKTYQILNHFVFIMESDHNYINKNVVKMFNDEIEKGVKATLFIFRDEADAIIAKWDDCRWAIDNNPYDKFLYVINTGNGELISEMRDSFHDLIFKKR